ncbi:hypothetical protein A1OO_03210 [Enterovibrio norvegicus FF-33]|uniref:hypothetical protein n=1 Tax=Enterovibrio norvegicus TaxID=188144 RepID=UPI000370A93C|nr:hypothetical protein [Enterovibrio norvegicus]OEE69804.1 hypothetical protein A1OO_03210 [Enterovibrio norvegicus FF-33]
MEVFEKIIVIMVGLLGFYAVLWAIPGVIMGAIVSLGDTKHITFIDSQLSKKRRNMQLSFPKMHFAHIATRLYGYWLAYPFIRNRATVSSKKFRFFMWVNCIGMWSWLLFFCIMLYRSALSVEIGGN